MLYLVLAVLGALNLYPFLWMIGTSLKSDDEASNERLKPIPGEKYRLADDLQIDNVLPLALEGGLAGTRPLAEQADLKRQLREVIRHQNSIEIGRANADAGEAARLAERRNALSAAIEAKAKLLASLHGKLEVIHGLQADAWKAAVAHRVEVALQDAPAGGIDARRMIDALLAKGVLVAAGDSYWLSPAACRGALPDGLSPSEKRVLEDLREYYTLRPRRYSQLAKLGPAASPLAAMRELVSRGLLVPVGADANAVRLAEGARGPVQNALHARQVLVLWDMCDVDVRNAESRATYAHDRRSPSNYAQNTGLATAGMSGQADAELRAMADAGYLVSARLLPINYWIVLKNENFLLHFLTSLIITAFVVFATIMLSSMLGYALARIRFPGKMLVFGIMIAAAILPGEARIIPIFKMLNAAGLMQSLWGMVLWMSSYGVGNSLLMAGFFWTLPKEVDEAAAVDGAGVFRTYFDIALPMARPIVMTVALFAFLGAWNDFMVPLLCTISRPAMQPLAVAVYNFQQGHAGMFQQINAAAAIMIVPVIMLFLLVQKHVVKAIAVGAVKG